MEAPEDDSLLDALELQPAPEYSIEPMEEIAALDIDLSPAPSPAPPPAPPPASPPARRPEAAKTTLVSKPGEAEEMRRKISRPSVPDLTLEELGDDDDDDFDELSLPTGPVADAASRRLERLPHHLEELPHHVEARPGLTTLPPAPASGTISTPPVSVALPDDGPPRDVTIPVEVRVGEGEAQITIHIRLTLSLKLER
jgi:hypothetical protein